MSIRLKLLLVTLVLTAIPMVGVNYVREMEAFLREGQERSVIALARAAATALHDRPALLGLREGVLSPEPPGTGTVEPGKGPPAAEPAAPAMPAPAAASGSLGANRLPSASGRPAAAPEAAGGMAVAPAGAAAGTGLRASTASSMAPGAGPSLGAPSGPPGASLAGGTRPSFNSGFTETAATTATDSSRAQEDASREIELIIRGLSRAQSRIWVIDQQRNLIAVTGSLRPDPDAPPSGVPEGVFDWIEVHAMEPLYRKLLEPPATELEDLIPDAVFSNGREVDSALAGIPASRWHGTSDERVVLLSAAHPIWAGERVIGAVIVEQSTLPVLSMRYRAFEQLLTATLLVFLLGAGALFTFASRLSSRLVKLQTEAENAIDPQGRVRGMVKGSRARDEIGDLARSFSRVLERLAQYNAYLERMADRLSHELRTPVAVVSSSLDNLKLQPLPDASVTYIDRAEQGLKRLNMVLTRMREASRLEQMLRDSERERFDLTRVVSGCVAGYASAFPQRQFSLRLANAPVWLMGVPDVVAQMLDKIVENAVDFSQEKSVIQIDVDDGPDHVMLSVDNVGPPLPQTMQGQLFESMISVRRATDASGASPHLGLGLFMVRLIAEFHRATARARNRADGRGVIVEVVFPRAEPAVPADERSRQAADR